MHRFRHLVALLHWLHLLVHMLMVYVRHAWLMVASRWVVLLRPLVAQQLSQLLLLVVLLPPWPTLAFRRMS